jgi:23S rRNA (cytidine1920-2'-O)/16S rRNA (cytidine1409-2'-O)-methyltransferase
VANLEGTDARTLDAGLVPVPPGLVVCDASFIGLAKVLPAGMALAEPGADLVCLVKPQFEVGPDRVGKGGLVKDAQARSEALEAAKAFVTAQGWRVLAHCDSPIAGGDGNREYLMHARKGPLP